MPVYDLQSRYKHIYTAGVIAAGLTLPVFIASNIEASQPVSTNPFSTESEAPVSTPTLIQAVREGQESKVRLLLDEGANINMISPGDGSPLIAAAAEGNAALVALLIKRGAEIDTIVPGDETALITAARHNHLSVVRLLVESGADVNLGVNADTLRGKSWRTPLNQAASPQIRRYLMLQGASDTASSEAYQ